MNRSKEIALLGVIALVVGISISIVGLKLLNKVNEEKRIIDQVIMERNKFIRGGGFDTIWVNVPDSIETISIKWKGQSIMYNFEDNK